MYQCRASAPLAHLPLPLLHERGRSRLHNDHVINNLLVYLPGSPQLAGILGQ
jgi:hypothetical protein